MATVSIIIPVYKAEKYIHACLESVRSQTYSDWECILVDDGSPDTSGLICDEFSIKDDRFKVYHKENGGVSDTRNFALDRISGDWVMFIDADDTISRNTLEIALKYVYENELDILQFSYTRNKSEIGEEFKSSATGVCSVNEYIDKDKILGAVWGNLIRSKIISDNDIRFDSKMKLAEDQIFMFRCISHAYRIQRIPDMLYYYDDNPLSATNNEKVKDIIYSSYQCIDFKRRYPEFSNRIDSLVLFFVEKLMSRIEYKICCEIITALKPLVYNFSLWPVRFIANISHNNIKSTVTIGVICYPVHRILLTFKHKLYALFKSEI